MRNTFSFIALVAAVVMVLLMPAAALGSPYVEITTTVDAQLISITTDLTSWDFGVVGAGSGASSNYITVTNNGTVPVSVTVRGYNATSTGKPDWTLIGQGGTFGADTYQMRFRDVTANAILYLSTEHQSWPTNPTIPAAGMRSFELAVSLGQPSAYGTYTAPVFLAAFGQ